MWHLCPDFHHTEQLLTMQLFKFWWWWKWKMVFALLSELQRHNQFWEDWQLSHCLINSHLNFQRKVEQRYKTTSASSSIRFSAGQHSLLLFKIPLSFFFFFFYEKWAKRWCRRPGPAMHFTSSIAWCTVSTALWSTHQHSQNMLGDLKHN